jgi:hypothetical protein
MTDVIRPHHNFAALVRQTDEKKAQTCANDISTSTLGAVSRNPT